MLNGLDLLKALRKLRIRSLNDPIEDEFRGWNYGSPPVKPKAYLGLAVSDLANRFCPSNRDLYLKYVEKVRAEPNQLMVNGKAYHEALMSAIRDVRSLVIKGFDGSRIIDVLLRKKLNFNVENAAKLYRFAVLQLAAEVDRGLSKANIQGVDAALSMLPQLVEVEVDGSPIGLSSHLRVDALSGNVLFEVKTGAKNEKHRLALAGYALAMECDREIPVDYALLVYVDPAPKTPRLSMVPVYISNELRQDFLELRDEVVDMIHSERDPGLASSCPSTCPFYRFCQGEVA